MKELSEQTSKESSGTLGKPEHYWDFVVTQLDNLESVKFINFQFEATQNNERGLAWLLITMSTQGELELAFKELFNNKLVLNLYSREDSYFWKNHKEVMEMIKVLKKKDLYIKSKVIGRFEEYIKTKLKEVNPAAAMKNLKDQKDTTSSEEEKKLEKKNERPVIVRRYSVNSEKMLTEITSRI